MEGDCRGQIEGVMPAYCLDELRKHAKILSRFELCRND